MKFKFGDKVIVNGAEFYSGCSGVVIEYDNLDNKYKVLFDHGSTKWFYDSRLRKIRKTASK